MGINNEILIAGFGGQGVLFAGKFIAYKGLMEDRQVSWLPSYGPEMRGGTANCSIILSDDQVGCPIVAEPTILTAMNLPSFLKYQDTVKSGGAIFIDSTLITQGVTRDDITPYYIPATQLANDNGMPTLANMILVGKMIKETNCVGYDGIEETLKKIISAKRAQLFELNLKAINIGYNYK